MHLKFPCGTLVMEVMCNIIMHLCWCHSSDCINNSFEQFTVVILVANFLHCEERFIMFAGMVMC